MPGRSVHPDLIYCPTETVARDPSGGATIGPLLLRSRDPAYQSYFNFDFGVEESRRGDGEWRGAVGPAPDEGDDEGDLDDGTVPKDEMGVTPFVAKLSYILDQAEHRDILRWSEDGKSIILAHTHPDVGALLSRYYRHSSVPSLVRQLNTYDFKRAAPPEALIALGSGARQAASNYTVFSNALVFRSTPTKKCDLSLVRPKKAGVPKEAEEDARSDP